MTRRGRAQGDGHPPKVTVTPSTETSPPPEDKLGGATAYLSEAEGDVESFMTRPGESFSFSMSPAALDAVLPEADCVVESLAD